MNNNIPLFMSIPHSGIKTPPEAYWLKGLDSSVLMCDVDAFVDDLYKPALKELQIPSVFFKWHRYSVDVNRFSTDTSPKTVKGKEDQNLKERTKINMFYRITERLKELLQTKKKKGYKNRIDNNEIKKSPSDIHWHRTTKGDLLIQEPLSKKLHEDLIKNYFDFFHQKIKEQIRDLKKIGHENIYILDLHSMPSKGLAFHKDKGENRKQIVISDNKGKSCSKVFRDLIITAYQKAAGFEVGLNWPYVGGAITQHYGQPGMGQHCLQVELNRNLYMDEKTKIKSSNYEKIQKQLKQAMEYIVKNWSEL